MGRFLGYFTTPIFLLAFALVLLIFHPIQVVCWRFFGYKAHQWSIIQLNWWLYRIVWLSANRTQFRWNGVMIPEGKTVVVVANHQSMNDIPSLIWNFRKYRLVFIAKKELSKKIPSISYNFTRGGAVGIDRKDSATAIPSIEAAGKRVFEEGRGICIFPEGTRARDGQIKKFSEGGIAALLRTIPNPIFVPVAIRSSWRMARYGFLPIPAGNTLKWDVLPVLDPAQMSATEVVKELESRISNFLQSQSDDQN